jgi:CBS-domain-containing membrane protein
MPGTDTLIAALGDLTVADAMHHGVVSCSPETSLRTVAHLLAMHRVHAVVVFPRHQSDAGHVFAWKVISALDLAEAASRLDLDRGSVADVEGSAVRCVQPNERLAGAVQTMLVKAVAHVIVVDRAHGRPVGILSSLDVARALAGYAWPDDKF